ncbi:MAG TPA: 2-succinyl-5-enolpyruvyl-6-hydroxy-3-cyclohexene-1-carboxylic-acid synthase [Dermatophilaceae bacterium]|nr:2-succinyl-5-enolpyruvyl-6-hydroxy-3-cyclohexene-1-carboxylic-acid synthase [Dermatophilaceae bacterium]
MNPSTAAATVIVDELVRGGVREVVVCPGSRSAPLAYAVQAAERAGRLRLHVRVDERSAGFLALGLAKGAGVPAVVVTTSGTAVANLHPAVLEASHAAVPMVVLTADRPHELRGTGANQTTVQPGIFGGAVRWSADLPAPEERAGQVAGWRAVTCRALAASRGLLGGRPGPVHVDVAFREPLVPDRADGAEPWPEPLEGRPGGTPWVALPAPAEVGLPAPAGATGSLSASPVTGSGPGSVPAPPVPDVERTLVVVGDLGDDATGARRADLAVAWAARRGYPVVAEPFAGGGDPPDRSVRPVLPHGPLLLTDAAFLDAHAPERVLVVGRPTLSRAVAALVRRPGVRVEVVTADPEWADPSALAAAAHPFASLTAEGGERPAAARGAWALAWHDAGALVAAAVEAALADGRLPWPTGLAVAATLGRALPAGARLVAGSSNAVRDLDLGLVAVPAGVRVLGNRGLAGIDGLLSTASGVALACGRPTYAWLGDLTFLHDLAGLRVAPGEPAADLTVLVTNDDGGGIFATLEHGEPERAADAERVVATPTGADLGALTRAHRIPHLLVTTPEELAEELAAAPSGTHVVEVRVDRASHRPAHATLRAVAAAALSAAPSAAPS